MFGPIWIGSPQRPPDKPGQKECPECHRKSFGYAKKKECPYCGYGKKRKK